MKKKIEAAYPQYHIDLDILNIIVNSKNAGITSVDLSSNRIAERAPATAAALKGTGITSVNLRGNSIAEHGPATAVAFKDTGVTSVHLSWNVIAEHGPATAAAFKGTGVTSVDLQSNDIAEHGPATAAAFKDTGVTSVHLDWNGIAEHAPATAAAFRDTGVTSVDLTKNDTTFEIDLMCLSIIWDHGQIYRLGIESNSKCGKLLQECIITILHNEFANQEIHGNDLLFPDAIEKLIGEYATIDLDHF